MTIHERHFKASMVLDRVARHLAQQFDPDLLYTEKGRANLDARMLVATKVRVVEAEYADALTAKGKVRS